MRKILKFEIFEAKKLRGPKKNLVDLRNKIIENILTNNDIDLDEMDDLFISLKDAMGTEFEYEKTLSIGMKQQDRLYGMVMYVDHLSGIEDNWSSRDAEGLIFSLKDHLSKQKSSSEPVQFIIDYYIIGSGCQALSSDKLKSEAKTIVASLKSRGYEAYFTNDDYRGAIGFFRKIAIYKDVKIDIDEILS